MLIFHLAELKSSLVVYYRLKIPIEAHDGDAKRHGTAWVILTIEDVNDHSPDIQITFIKYSQNNTGNCCTRRYCRIDVANAQLI